MHFVPEGTEVLWVLMQLATEDVIFHSRIVWNCFIRLRIVFTLSKRIVQIVDYELATSNSNI